MPTSEQQLLANARENMRENVKTNTPYNPYDANEEQKKMLRNALEKENSEAKTPGFDPLTILVHEYNNLIRKSLGEKEIPLDIMSFSPVLTPWRKECVLTGTNRCPCTPGGPGGCYPSPSPSPPTLGGEGGGGGGGGSV